MSIGAARYTPGGDEHVFVELSEEMSLEAFFKGMAITTALERMKVPGVSEICPANASYQVRFDPDLTHPDAMVKILQRIEAEVGTAELELATRIVEIPVLFDDPWTNETQLRFRERHQDPSSTDLQYAARINGYASVADFVAAYCGSPWFVSMVGFVAGLPFMFQMVERARQIEVPKYLRPRTDTPKLTIGHGGSVGEAGRDERRIAGYAGRAGPETTSCRHGRAGTRRGSRAFHGDGGTCNVPMTSA